MQCFSLLDMLGVNLCGLLSFSCFMFRVAVFSFLAYWPNMVSFCVSIPCLLCGFHVVDLGILAFSVGLVKQYGSTEGAT